MILPGFPKPMIVTDKGPPNIGDPWQGGYYIGNFVDGGLTYGLVVAPKATGQNDSIRWKTTATTTAGTLSTTNGPANLAAMVSAGIAAHPAGEFCYNLSIGGFTDWYPPSENENFVLYDSRLSIVGPDAFDIDTIFYWSSTEYSLSPGYARTHRFSNNQNSSEQKDRTCRVRAIRRVLL